MSLLTNLSNGLVILEKMASRALILGFVGLIIVNVASRYLIGQPIDFAEELAAILLVWLAFVAISISIADRSQVCVSMFVDMLPSRGRVFVGKLITLICIFMLAALLWASIGWLKSPATAFEQIITTGWAKLPFFLIVPIFCATSLIHMLATLLVPIDAELET